MNCDQCGREINEKIETVHYSIEGWEKEREQGGTNHVELRKRTGKFRCNACMTLILAGLSSGQVTLEL